MVFCFHNPILFTFILELAMLEFYTLSLDFYLGLNLVWRTWFFKERMVGTFVSYVLLTLFSFFVNTFSHNITCFYQQVLPIRKYSILAYNS